MDSLGRHILVEFTDCDTDILDDVQVIESEMIAAAVKASATLINATFHHFSPLGVSGVIVIQESHFAIHTWPEYGYAAVDLFTCGDSVEPWKAFDYLKSAFVAGNYSAIEMRRGSIEILEPLLKLKELRLTTEEKIQPRFKRNIWFTDRDNAQALSLRYTGDVLFDKKSEYNRIRVIDTYAYGKTITSGNRLICTEQDEYHYHEMIAHPVLLTCENIKKVLIIGGGDGGTAREVLKHPNVELVDLVEIDAVVVEASQKFMPKLSSALQNPRLKLHITDALEFIQDIAPKTYDFIIIDGPHSAGKLSPLYSKAFFKKCKSILTGQGAFLVQGESPKFNKKAFIQIDKNLKAVFDHENKFNILFNIPTFPSGIWSFQVIFCNGDNPLGVKKQKINNFLIHNKTNYYNYETHLASFAIPEYMKKMLQ